MGDDIQNIKTTAEDLAVERAEQQLADPSALNMQFLQSTLNSTEFDGLSAGSSFFTASAKGTIPNSSQAGSGFGGLSPAFSGAGLLGAVAAADMSSASSALGMAAQVASAAPVTFGKRDVGESATLAGLGNKALAEPNDLSNFINKSTLLKPVANADGSLVPVSAEFTQLMAMLEGNGNGVNADDALMSLIDGLGQNPSAENLQAAIDAVLDQISLLSGTFDSVFDGLDGEVQSMLGSQNGLPSTDLGLSIRDDAGEVSMTISDLLGSVDVVSNPQIDSLLNLDSTFDEIVSLIDSLPELDLAPITEPILDPITDVVDDVVDDVVEPILDPVVDPITDVVDDVVEPILDPVVDPITDVVDDVVEPILDPVVDPITDVVDDVVDDVVEPILDPVIDPILDPITDISDPLLDPILDPITDGGLLSGLSSSSNSDSDIGLLDSLSSGISSSAGSEGGSLDGLLGSLDQNK